ncbi:MAG: XrtA system polysaccharide deacetylase [Candidatus Thiodiazotropha sp. 6PLUC1]
MMRKAIENSMAIGDKLINAITVDVEDYYQVSAFNKQVQKEQWESYESRVFNNTHRILKIFDDKKIKGTFFVLGWVAERNQKLIREIHDLGHEVACHGYSHDLIYKQTPEQFLEETSKSKKILEDIIGTSVNGYRAASYSITSKSLWALDILAECGFTYDSSIFPIMHDRYGIPGADTKPHISQTEKGNKIVEFPLSTVGVLNRRFPVSGGGYFRLFPYWLSKAGLRRVNKHDNVPFIFYMHPWEIDEGQPKIKSSMLSEFRHYNNIDKFETRLLKLIDDFEFSTVSDVLQRLDFIV